METTYAEQHIEQFNKKLDEGQRCALVDGELHVSKSNGDWAMTFIYPIDNDNEGMTGKKRAVFVSYKGENLLALDGDMLTAFDQIYLDETETAIDFIIAFRLEAMNRLEQEEETK